jgi:hypothetical protein
MVFAVVLKYRRRISASLSSALSIGSFMDDRWSLVLGT